MILEYVFSNKQDFHVLKFKGTVDGDKLSDDAHPCLRLEWQESVIGAFYKMVSFGKNAIAHIGGTDKEDFFYGVG